MSTYTQQDRLLVVSTPLGEDALLLAGFDGEEALSQLFSYHLKLLSVQSDIEAKDIVGKNVTIGIRRADGEYRYLNGFVKTFSYIGTDPRFSRYSAQVVPWMWFLTCTRNCRI